MRFSRKAKRELSWIVLFAACLALLYTMLFGEGGVIQLHQYQADLLLLQQENSRLRQRHREYLDKIDRLKTSPEEIERIARERYNLARPGDIIVNLQD